jgi:hypothetical protein
MIACAIGHHIMEARWLHNQAYLNDYVHLWYRGNEGQPMEKLRKFSSWTADALYRRYLVNMDKDFLLGMIPDLENDYVEWEKAKRNTDVLFWQYDVRDGMEEQISGGRRVKNLRPTINSYMYGNAIALSNMNKLAGNHDKEDFYLAKADTLKNLIQSRMWSENLSFFETIRENGEYANVREAIGYIPWYFNLPDEGYEIAWEQIKDEKGFAAPFGITTAERRHPEFRSHGCCNCEWDGAVWPFTTSQTLVAMDNLITKYNQDNVNDSVYFHLLEQYVESSYYRGRPYIGEYLDESTGYWLKGDQERSRYYNHSTFNDLIITGLVGLNPREDNTLEIEPLLPDNTWDWFCLDNVLYHGKIITILWDKDGSKYEKGKGLLVFVNGKIAGSSDKLEKIECEF